MKSFGRQKFNFMEEFIKKKYPESLKHTHTHTMRKKKKKEIENQKEKKNKLQTTKANSHVVPHNKHKQATRTNRMRGTFFPKLNQKHD